MDRGVQAGIYTSGRANGIARRTGIEPRAGTDREIMKFDYQAPAELFMAKRSGRQRLGYRRFATAAEAIRFAVEEFPAIHTLATYLQVGDERFDSDEIHRLYESVDYPLRRSR